ncbi:siderophore-interacting protein [Paracoccus sp. SCSIO 75233]|uniref:siderophore-interacting protein n=1 Tax=Paracoccus sp. SCSIO 75233 TaxID=3017782 RepID=UPI0022F0BDA8|nr:siderophore-interacting protein [Paracoccus sp. SCSIO 75233]WBU52676.1 siderophore-interacting protein [Paracoccus sp. SCSIO 75233]
MPAPEIRRFPITLRELQVVAVRDLSPRMRRITLGGPQLGAFELDGQSYPAFESPGPDPHVKIFLPDPDTGETVLPTRGDGRLHWPDDPPATAREYTPRGFVVGAETLDIDFVLHGHGAAGLWAAQAAPGQVLHIGGPRAARLLPEAAGFLLFGDESALPAIANWLEQLPSDAKVTAHILIEAEEARLDLRAPDAAHIHWHSYDPADPQTMARLVDDADIPRDHYVWAGGERGAIAALREVLDGRDLDPDHVRLSNYWTLGQASD